MENKEIEEILAVNFPFDDSSEQTLTRKDIWEVRDYIYRLENDNVNLKKKNLKITEACQ